MERGLNFSPCDFTVCNVMYSCKQWWWLVGRMDGRGGARAPLMDRLLLVVKVMEDVVVDSRVIIM